MEGNVVKKRRSKSNKPLLMNIQKKRGGGLISFSKSFLGSLSTTTVRIGYNSRLGRMIVKPEEQGDANTLSITRLNNGGRASSQSIVNFCKDRGFSGKLFFTYDDKENAYYSYTQEEMAAYYEQKALEKSDDSRLAHIKEKMELLLAEYAAQKEAEISAQAKYNNEKSELEELLKHADALAATGDKNKELYKEIRAKESALSVAERDIRKKKKDIEALERSVGRMKDAEKRMSEV